MAQILALPSPLTDGAAAGSMGAIPLWTTRIRELIPVARASRASASQTQSTRVASGATRLSSIRKSFCSRDVKWPAKA